jgi:hypothetical protein
MNPGVAANNDGDNNPSDLLAKLPSTREESKAFNSETSAVAAAAVVDDVSDEVICIICQEEFDLDLHLPKMLEFCHHTFCLSCLKVIHLKFYILIFFILLNNLII